MITRKLVGIGTVTLAFVVAFGFAQQGQTQEKKIEKQVVQKLDHSEHSREMQECAKACSDCQRACDQCATHCSHLIADGKKEHMTAMMNCQDCASVCAAASQIVSRGGPHSSLICDACAKACDQCAAACEKFPSDPQMIACAAECRKCEKACRAMLKHMMTK